METFGLTMIVCADKIVLPYVHFELTKPATVASDA